MGTAHFLPRRRSLAEVIFPPPSLPAAGEAFSQSNHSLSGFNPQTFIQTKPLSKRLTYVRLLTPEVTDPSTNRSEPSAKETKVLRVGKTPFLHS